MRDLSNKNVIHVVDGDIQYLQFKRLLKYKKEINHAYTLGLNVGFKAITPDTKMTENEKYNFVIESYKKICKSMGTDYKNIVRATQDHTDKIKIIKEKNDGEPYLKLTKEIVEDGLITNKNNIILSTTNADCILLIFFDPVKKVIANTHSGWRGTVQRISVKTIRKMIQEYNCNAEDIICCICPSIRKCHFEVEKDVKEIFEKEFKDLNGENFIDIDNKNEMKKINTTDFIEEKIKDKKWNIDTVIINKIILQREGLKPEHIIDSGICSVCNSDMIHSYRVERKNYKTETALIELKK